MLFISTVINIVLLSLPLVFIETDVAEYLSRPVTWIYYGLMTAFCFMEAHTSIRRPDRICAKPEKTYLPYVTGILLLSVFWISIFEYLISFQFNLIATIAGALMIAIGIATRVSSISELGEYFVSHIGHLKDHKLVTTGLYAYSRHPSELGLLLICAGTAIVLSSINGFLLTVLAIFPLTVYRIYLEDQLLLSLFGDKYRAYKSNVPGLVPNIFARKKRSQGINI